MAKRNLDQTRRKNLIFIVFFLPIFFLSQTTAKVVRIKDGDTVVVLLNDNTEKTLRLAEVDCPESGQPFGKNAKQFTSDQIFGKTIEFVETDTDRYGRSVAKIYYDEEKYLSAEIIKAGMGWWYHQYSRNTELGIFQEAAKNNRKGLWADINAISPYEFRQINKNKEK
ncbi:thermonuclease family protein [Chryseobacterium sp. 5_R23647]|uniref:thermonuclease family protein n=1 Tax=Chryseobacterium sp. 5_R23647 TaxID=2258964 RepID=UPI000E22A66D|nr:thermonuclease family protein [Chryseobacterium sp. 5_R23647]REC39991.1 nuclease [Chryseobacterium sp. 5_R23647]